MDLAAAKTKAGEQDHAIADLQKAATAREQAFESRIRTLESLKVTAKTPPAIILDRLAHVEPELELTPNQLIPPKPDAPAVNLSLEPSQQTQLVNRLVDCKECEANRDKLQLDLLGAIAEKQAMAKERDAYKTAAQGGSLKVRIKRRFWHFLEDAAIVEGLRIFATKHP